MTRPTRTRKTATNLGLPAGSLEYFKDLAEDAPNWSGSPYTQGNVDRGRSTAGYVGRLRTAGLIETHDDENAVVVTFTPAGVRAAAQLGIDLTSRRTTPA